MTSNTCRNCGGELVGEPLPEYIGNLAIDEEDSPAWLEYDGDKHYVRCQQCSAVNIFIISEDPSGTLVLTVSRAMMEDE